MFGRLLIGLLTSVGIFLAITFMKSKDCSQLVIDRYEINSGIDIPNATTLNCYYHPDNKTRISILELDSLILSDRFTQVSTHELKEHLLGYELLNPKELPHSENVHVAHGLRWGKKWSYVYDSESRRLWASLVYRN